MVYGFHKGLWYAPLGLSLLLCATTQTLAAEPADDNVTDFREAAKTIAKPREIWPILQREHVVPLEFTIESDETITSDTDPSQKLRKVTAHFWSQQIAGKKWGHPCVTLMPVDTARNMTPERKGKVVMLWVAYSDNPQWRDAMWYHYHMWNRGDHYEGNIHGKVPDAFMVEVSDIAQGISGYVSPPPAN